MKCPKCDYVSHDYQDECRKCHIDLLTFKQQLGLFVLRPNILDLGLVLTRAESDSRTGVAVRDAAEDFDISLDDFSETTIKHPAGGASATPPSPGNHLTLELDANLTFEGLDSFQMPEAPTIPTQNAEDNDRMADLDHLTLELASEEAPLDLLNAIEEQAEPEASAVREGHR